MDGRRGCDKERTSIGLTAHLGLSEKTKHARQGIPRTKKREGWINIKAENGVGAVFRKRKNRAKECAILDRRGNTTKWKNTGGGPCVGIQRK